MATITNVAVPLFIIVSLALKQAASKTLVCSAKDCGVMLVPLCGSDGVTYDNICKLDQENCRRPPNNKISIVKHGQCDTQQHHVPEPPKCEKVCSLAYGPVCASDGTTYINKCGFDNENCARPLDKKLTVIIQGICETAPPTPKPKCEKDCSLAYRPVCGSDGTTYINICALENENCARPKDKKTTVAHNGHCDETPIKPKCEKECSLAYRPVCGSDGTTYINICAIENENCARPKDKKITVAHNGHCDETPIKPKCEKDCSLAYRPVCGSDGTTYINICALENENCARNKVKKITVAHNGHCDETPIKQKCEKDCSLVLRPVCGSDGTTYINKCALENENCGKSTKITKIKNGKCEKPKPTEKPKCVKECSGVFRPVCGADGYSYVNQCALDNENCSKPANNKISVLRTGTCESLGGSDTQQHQGQQVKGGHKF